MFCVLLCVLLFLSGCEFGFAAIVQLAIIDSMHDNVARFPPIQVGDTIQFVFFDTANSHRFVETGAAGATELCDGCWEQMTPTMPPANLFIDYVGEVDVGQIHFACAIDGFAFSIDVLPTEIPTPLPTPLPTEATTATETTTVVGPPTESPTNAPATPLPSPTAAGTTGTTGTTVTNAASDTTVAIATSNSIATTTSISATTSTLMDTTTTEAPNDGLFGGACGSFRDCQSCAGPDDCGWCGSICTSVGACAMNVIIDNADCPTEMSPCVAHDDSCENCLAEDACAYCQEGSVTRCIGVSDSGICFFGEISRFTDTCDATSTSTSTSTTVGGTTEEVTTETSAVDSETETSTVSGTTMPISTADGTDEPFTQSTLFFGILGGIGALCCLLFLIICICCMVGGGEKDNHARSADLSSGIPMASYRDPEQPQRLDIEWIPGEEEDLSTSSFLTDSE